MTQPLSESSLEPFDGLRLQLDRSGPIPLYYQISQRLAAAIEDGQLPVGARIENEIDLAARLNVSRPTIRRAIQDLVDQGALVRRRGIGTQVVHGKVTRDVVLTSLHEDLEALGRAPSTELLTLETITAPSEVANELSLPLETEVVHLRRLRYSAGTALSVMENYLPLRFGELSEPELADHGLYQLLRAQGVTFKVARQKIGARTAAKDEARLLEVTPGSPLLTMQRTAYDNSGEVIEFGRHVYRPDLYAFDVTLVSR